MPAVHRDPRPGSTHCPGKSSRIPDTTGRWESGCMEFRDVVRRRRMVRRYGTDPVDPAVVDRMLEHAQRAPNAGFSQGWAFLVLDTPADVARFWESTGAGPDTHNAWLDGMRTAPV